MRHTFKRLEQINLTGITILLALAIVSCSGQDFGFLQPTPKDLCKCLRIEPDIADYLFPRSSAAQSCPQWLKFP